ncbi:Beta-lactamase class A [Actinoplanes philippinensis]|uniref:Beta-lactamase class A n=1 Tax=Actinoplanes philippinensis TaxID=35752 RepID=A0A1I2M0R9_9ACTN|nr:serine hydrolase [Actinoplanes philippinensis]SFF83137.1 Beta-lactamase class A [Actinoplanes philippinensis]
MRSKRVWIIAAAAVVAIGGGGLVVAADLSADEPAHGTPVPAAAVILPALPAIPAAAASPTSSAAAFQESSAAALQASSGAVSPASPVAGGQPSPTAAAVDRATRVKRLDAALKATKGDFAVAVLDRKTGQRYVYRGSVRYDTASIVKVQILACMLLKAQDAGRAPTAAEMKLARPMIRLSDNNATTSLYQKIGGKSAVTGCNKRLGLTQTVVNSRWGLTRTTAADQVVLLSELVDTRGPLSASSRKTAFTLMNTVDKAQDWGVPVLAKKDEIFTVKNGWDTRTADGGLWAVNTIGRITAKNGSVDVSVAVLTRRNKNMTAGVTLVEKVAKLTRQHLAY